MFPAVKAGEWEPHKVRKKTTPTETNGDDGAVDEDKIETTANAEEPEYEEDLVSDEGAVWPMKAGKIVNWSCFFGLMSHIYQTINPPFHTPILLIAEPSWSPKDFEKITQFFFEKFRMPGFALMGAAQAICYAFGVNTACVVDVGEEKADVTAVTDFLVDDIGRAIAIPNCGGETMTQRLFELLGSKGFTREMCEQLKRSPICEVLPPGTPLPGTQPKQNTNTTNPAAQASTGADGSGPNQRHSAGSLGQAPRGPGQDTEVGGDERKEDDDNEGVLDVASIVAGGKMNEFLARREKEKAEKLAAKKKGEANAAGAKALRLKNSERERNTFYFEDHALLDALKGSNLDSNGVAEANAALDEGPHKANGASQTMTQGSDLQSAIPTSPILSKETSTHAPRRELTVGTERFQAASGDILTILSTAIHRVILSISDPASRPDLWNSLIIVGNGSAIRGFKEALLATLHSRFLISPSSATIFTSELPSNLSTPLATGANTPAPQSQGQGQLAFPAHGSGVNPLLIAATTASAQAQAQTSASGHLQPPGGHANSATTHTHSSHAQTPTSIRLAKLPDYFPEWKDAGSEEASFLGAQVAAKMLFVIDQGGAGKGYMSRTDYNEQGPSGIHDYTL